jgi:hypothetical protein
MKVLKVIESPGYTVEEVMEEFNERCEEFGIFEETQIISVSARNSSGQIKIAKGKETVEAKVIVSIFYWSDGL